MKKIFTLIVLLATAFSLFVSCNKISEGTGEPSGIEIVGTADFLSNLNSIKPTISKGGEITEEEAAALLAPALLESKNYLEENGYDFREDFTENDPRIIWVATGLAEYDKLYLHATKTTVGGCVLQAIGVTEIVKSGGKKLVKAIAKQALKKAIPYVGAALVAVDFIACVTED